MKTKKLLFYITGLAIHLFAIVAEGQDKNWKPLKIGDKVPEVILEKLVNYSQTKMKLSQLRGKLVILDFWNKWCASCIANFPHMQDLQNHFGNKLQVLLVTTDKEAELKSLFKKPIVRGVQLPFVLEDKILSKYFPYTTVPFHVWIDKDGIVRALTSHYQATEKNIEEYFQTGRLQLPVQTFYTDFNPAESLLKEGNGRQLPNLKYYSLIMNHVSGWYGASQGINRDVGGNMIGLKAINNSILGLYEMAYRVSLYDRHTLLLLDTNHPQQFYTPADKTQTDEWMEKNTYCYESQFPAEKVSQRYNIMQQDLDRFFNLTTHLEKKRMSCFVLVKKDSITKLKTAGGEEIYQKDNALVLKNLPFSMIVKEINHANFKTNNPKLLDETGEDPNLKVDIQVTGDLKDIENVRRQLNQYGLEILTAEREVEVLVIEDKKP